MRIGVILAGTACGFAAFPAFAQEAPPPASVEGPRTFTPEDFARFAPRNALDMLRQVPGFIIRDKRSTSQLVMRMQPEDCARPMVAGSVVP